MFVPSRGLRAASVLIFGSLATLACDDGKGDPAQLGASTSGAMSDQSTTIDSTSVSPLDGGQDGSTTSVSGGLFASSSGTGFTTQSAETEAETASETASDTTGDTDNTIETTEGLSDIAIAGTWNDDFGGLFVIDNFSWTQTYGRDTYNYGVESYDNELQAILAQDTLDGTYSKFEWAYVDTTLYYCQSAYGLASIQEASDAPGADATDPAADGCGGFSWSRLTPAS